MVAPSVACSILTPIAPLSLSFRFVLHIAAPLFCFYELLRLRLCCSSLLGPNPQKLPAGRHPVAKGNSEPDQPSFRTFYSFLCPLLLVIRL